MRRLFLILIGGGILGFLAYWAFFAKELQISVVYAEDGFIKKNTEKLPDNLKKSLKKAHISPTKPIDIYAANFFVPHIPQIQNKEHFNILILGSYQNVNLLSTNEYDLILTSSPDLMSFLKYYGIRAHFFPMFTRGDDNLQAECAARFDDKKCYVVLFGASPLVQQVLEDRGISFVLYEKADFETAQKLISDIGHISGVVFDNNALTSASMDYSPFLLDVLWLKIPVLTQNIFAKDASLHLLTPLAMYVLGDYLTYYKDKDEVLNFFLHTKEALRASRFIKSFLSVEAAAERLAVALKDKKPPFLKSTHFYNIISSTHAGLYNNGDYWIAKDLENIFYKNGIFSGVSFPLSLLHDEADVSIYLRGGIPLSANIKRADTVSLMYILFPPLDKEEDLSDSLEMKETYFKKLKNEFSYVDGLTVSSKTYAQWLKSLGVKAYYVPQFTNTDKFHPDFSNDLKSDVLFVGNKTFYRKTPQILLNHHLPIDIYGGGWGRLAKAEYIDNRILRKYYSSAKIVLNDTRPAMRKFDFIPNRIFDVTACGALVISDYIPEIEEFYGDSVPMWKTEEELVALVKYYLDPAHEEERLEKAKQAQEITLKYFTVEKVAQQFDEIIAKIKREKQIDD
ncbi:MAG: glycosyltransferase [Alphaproteobacteria bacterium]|nr:glycosyltransferase [Alphaproteobacteria bacterium]